jgi:tetratricopeptide (TPR) repeat protein
MIENHPSNTHIYFENSTEFLARPSYHAEVLRRLEDRVKTEPSSGAYWVLALTCQNRAIPPDLGTDAKKRRFLTYHGLDSDAGLPKHVDQELVAKSIRYFKKAIELATEDQSRHSKDAELAENDRWHQNFYLRQLLDFYSSLDRHADALELCKTLAQRKENLADADFLLTYGEWLFSAGKLDDAKTWLVQVRSNDHEGFEHGPAHATVAAETTLGLIALKHGDIGKAVEHLDASTQVQKCWHNTTNGFPTVLASEILEEGQPVPVVRFCETVLREFTPNRDDLKALMERAKTAPHQQKTTKP